MITNCRISMLFGADTPGERDTPIEDIRGEDKEILDYIHRHEEAVRTAIDAELWLTFTWQDQCNLAFEAETIGEISRLGMVLCISCSEE